MVTPRPLSCLVISDVAISVGSYTQGLEVSFVQTDAISAHVPLERPKSRPNGQEAPSESLLLAWCNATRQELLLYR